MEKKTSFEKQFLWYIQFFNASVLLNHPTTNKKNKTVYLCKIFVNNREMTSTCNPFAEWKTGLLLNEG